MSVRAPARDTHGRAAAPAAPADKSADELAAPARDTHGRAAAPSAPAAPADKSADELAAPARDTHGRAAALDAALDQLGPFGLYQGYTLFMLCIPSVLGAMYSLNYVFVADQVPFRCVVPECEGESPAYWSAAAAALAPEQCRRYAPLQPLNESCLREHYHAHDTLPCDRLVYENTDTTYGEFDLGCREWLRTLVGTVRNSALPLALLLTGYVCDTFGRRTALCVFAACAAVLGIIKGFSVNYQMYLAMEFLEAALGYGFTSAAYVMKVELARPSLRAAFACASGVAYGLGGVAFAGLAWRVRYWRHLLWTIHAAALPLPLCWLLVDESWRWLVARGRPADAARLVRKAARWNKVILDENVMKKLSDEDEPPPAAPAAAGGGGGARAGVRAWAAVARSRVLLARLGAVAWCWAAVAFVYYGLTINSVSLAGDKYVNFALNMAMEVVASLLLVMALERFGRKWSIFAAFLVCGLACVTPFVVADASTALAMFFVGKLAITFAFNSLYVFTAELFPTAARAAALAACSLLGRVGSIVAPQTPLASATVQAVLYGACSALAALAVLLLPETRRAALPDDVAAAEHIAAPPLAPAAPAPAAPVLISADL